MLPFIVDPTSYKKDIAFTQAKLYVDEFLALNGLHPPTRLITIAETKNDNRWKDYGWYTFIDSTMFVNLKKSRTPVKTPGFQWSYTGFKADLTAPGILAHETGHHIHRIMSIRNDDLGIRKMVDFIYTSVEGERSVSGYEPNAYEVFAESTRLFILNPELLRLGRPKRWSMLTDRLGLKPPHDVHWRHVLKHAHPRIIAAAEKWISNNAL